MTPTNKYRMTASIGPTKLRALSAEGSVLPDLVPFTKALGESHIEKLHRELVPLPWTEIPCRFLRVFRKVSTIAEMLPFLHRQDGRFAALNQQRILDETELVMHEICALVEYLGKLVKALLPPAEKKNKAAQAVIKRLEHKIKRLITVPVNKIKHDGFRLTWCEAYLNKSAVMGFIVNGPIGKHMTGPANYRYGDDVVAEAYSFSLFLRKTVEILYQLCSITQDFLSDEFALRGARSTVGKGIESQELLGSAKDALLYLSFLPQKGFPAEQEQEVLDMVVDGDTVRVARTFRLKLLKPGWRFQFIIPSVSVGQTIQFPFWNPR